MRWNAIYKRIKDIKNPVGAEIGVYRGELSAKILEFHPELVWYMIDKWNTEPCGDTVRFKRYKELFEDRAEENWKYSIEITDKYFMRRYVFRESSMESVKTFPDKSLDIVFIDSDHMAIREDITAWLPKVKIGGWISGHDYGSHAEGIEVKIAVDEIFEKSQIEIDCDFTWFVRVA